MTPLRQRRLELGLGQAHVAQTAGLSRQALSALEAGRAQPSLANALALAHALAGTVEGLFGAPDHASDAAAWSGVVPADGRVCWSRIAGRLVVRPARPDEEIDAVVEFEAGRPRRLRPLPGAVDPWRSVWIGGCDPALGLLARAMERAAPHLRVTAVALTSAEAEAALASGQLHVASLHGRHDPGLADADRIPYVAWREGFLLREGLDRDRLFQPAVRWALRPPGATARTLFERSAPADASRAAWILPSHWAVADAIRTGQADAGVAVEAAASAFGLAFVPLEEEQVELAVHPAAPEAADALRRALADERLWSRLAALPGYRRAGG